MADAPDDVVSGGKMPARPRPADAHAALAVGLPPCGRLWLMLMMLCGSCRTVVASSMMMLFRVVMPARPGPADAHDAVALGRDACKARAS